MSQHAKHMLTVDNIQYSQATEHMTQRKDGDWGDNVVLHKSGIHPGKYLFINLSSDDNMQDKVEKIPDTPCLILCLPSSG